MLDLRYPNITGTTEKEQLTQMKSYLHQLVEQLQWAMNNIDTAQSASQTMMTVYRGGASSSAPTSSTPQATFDSIKALIIKSAEIVDAYYEEINKRLESEYVAQSDFGTFKQQMSQDIKLTSDKVEQTFTNIQIIESNVGGLATDVSSLGENLTTVEGNVTTLGQNLTAVEGNVSTLGENLSAVEGNVSTLGENLSTVEGNVSTLGENVTGLGNELTATKTNVDGAIDALTTEVDTAKGELAQTKKDTKDLSDAVDKVEKEVAGVKSDLTSTKTDYAASLADLNDGLKAADRTLVEIQANIKYGRLTDDAIPVYGIEVGQTVSVDGNEAFNKFARFTAERLSFYDRNGYEVAYISDYKLYITNAEITGTLKLGGFKVDTSSGLTLRWEGRR